MKISVKNTLFVTILYLLLSNNCHAMQFDTSIDDEIRKNYNPSKLIDDVGFENNALEKKLEATSSNIDEPLPALPNITKQGESTKKSDVNANTIISKAPPLLTNGNIKIKKGTSFNVVNLNTISDWQVKGTKLTFKTNRAIFNKKYTIPENTVFYGEIIDSHQPQITCNGGLVVIKIYSMIYKGQTVPINAYITRANDKKIFFNNIKGDRTYLKTVWKKGNWGRTLFNKMMTLTINLGATGSTLVLSPFPLAYGTLCLGANTLLSPITAFFSKGGHISIPTNSNFKIKLTEDIFVN